MATKRKKPPESSAKRVPLSLRVTPQLKSKLDAAAVDTGRSQTQEIEFRLEQSFDRTELIFDSMKLAYGAELAGLLMLIGRAMSGAGRTAGLKANTFQFTGEEWLADPFAYDQASNAAVAVLKGLRPPKRVTATGGDAKFAETMSVLVRTSNSNSWGEAFGKNVLGVLRGEESVVAPTGWIERVKELLGTVGQRVSKDGDSTK